METAKCKYDTRKHRELPIKLHRMHRNNSLFRFCFSYLNKEYYHMACWNYLGHFVWYPVLSNTIILRHDGAVILFGYQHYRLDNLAETKK